MKFIIIILISIYSKERIILFFFSNDNSMNNVKSLYKDEIIQLEKKNEELELEKKNWKNKYSEVLNQLHNSERIRFEVFKINII